MRDITGVIAVKMLSFAGFDLHLKVFSDFRARPFMPGAGVRKRKRRESRDALISPRHGRAWPARHPDFPLLPRRGCRHLKSEARFAWAPGITTEKKAQEVTELNRQPCRSSAPAQLQRHLGAHAPICWITSAAAIAPSLPAFS